MALFDILVNLAANTASFQSGMERAERQLQSFGETAKHALEFAGVATSIGEVVHKFDEFVERAEAISTASAKTGMAVEQLSRLEYAAKQSGVATEALTGGLDKFAKTVAAAAGGSQLQSKAFAAMGISLNDSEGHLKTTQELLEEVADRFAGYKDGAEKAALAQILFGRGGAELIPLLDKGRQGIEDYGKRLDALGATLSGETVKAAEEFHSKMTDLQAVMQGTWDSIAGQLAPALGGLVDYFIKGSNAAGGFADQLRPVVNILKFIADAAFSVERTFEDIGRAIGALAAIATSPIKQASQIWKDYTEDAERAEQAANDWLNNLWGGEAQSKLQNWEQSVKSAWDAVANGAKISAPVVQIGQTEQDFLANWMLKQGNDAQKQAADTGNRIMDESMSAATRFTDGQHDQWLKARKAAEDAFTDMDRLGQKTAESLQSAFANFLFNPLQGGFKHMAIDFLNTLRRMAADAAAAGIFKALFGGSDLAKPGSGAGGLGGIFGGFLNSAFGTGGGAGGGNGAKGAIGGLTGALGSALGKYVGGLFGGGGGGVQTLSDADYASIFATSGAGAGAASAASGALSDVDYASIFGLSGAMAEGGLVSAGSSYLVGEEGPELFTPSSHGIVTSNSDLGAIGGGDTHIHMGDTHIDARGADADRIMTMLPPILARHAAQTKADMLNAFRRTGLPAPVKA